MFLLVTESTLAATFVLNLMVLLGDDMKEDLNEEWVEAVPALLCSVSAMAISACFGLSLLALIWVQTVNLARGRTTSERFSRHPSEKSHQESACKMKHCIEMCCDSDSVHPIRYPGAKSTHTTITEEPEESTLHAPLINA